MLGIDPRVNIGDAANDGTGDALRDSFDKLNGSFTGAVHADWFEDGDGDDALLARAIAAMGSRGTLQLNARTYTISSVTSVGPNETGYAQYASLRIVGHGYGAGYGTQILQTSASANCIEATDTILHIEGVLFRNSNTTNTSNAIKIINSSHGSIRRCAMMQFGGAAIRFSGTANHTYSIAENLTQNCAWGVLVESATQLLSATIGPRNEFTSTEAADARTCIGVELKKGINVVIRENTIEVLKYGVKLNSDPSGGSLDILLDSNYFEEIDDYAVYLAGTGQFTGLTIRGDFSNLTDSSYGIFCDACQFFGLEITSNVVSPDAGVSINLSAATNFRWGSSITLTGGDFTSTDLFLPTSGVDLPRVYMGSTVLSSRKATMTADITINPTDALNTYLLTPDANRLVTPASSGWIQNQTVTLVNLGSFTLTFDPLGINRTVLPGETGEFRYEGSSGWSLRCDAGILGSSTCAFRGALTIAGATTLSSTLAVTGITTLNNTLLIDSTGRFTFGSVNSVSSLVLRAEAAKNMVFQYDAGSVGATMDATGMWLIGSTVPANPTTAILELASTTRGFLPTRMTQAQRDAITSPPNGLEIYNTTSGKKNVRENGAWVKYTATADP